MRPSSGSKTKRFGKDDWLAFGLSRLASDGPEALKLNALVGAAGKTIGSFYHHFEDQSEFFEALVFHWRDTNTRPIIAALEAVPDPAQKADRLADLATRLDAAVEMGVRSFASQNPVAAAALAEVDALRIDYVSGMYQQRFALPASEADTLARLEYAAFVGTQMLFRDQYAEMAPTLAAAFQKLLRGGVPAPRS
ncbi:TetR/AcrR family transcriptional regulator [Dinoroseobacter sp. S375]|uniref:TetR/AcrR family transcriptional regulator n=1 Tax=Dinoroseobacter sp. S375 TaxID=3415136 RepID=UPI003C7D5061